MVEVVDTIIVGAGLSGLEAAIQLQKAGRSFTILEARDRVGGKIWSVQRPDGKGVQEIGAAWINDSNQSHIWQYCKAFNLTPVVQNVEGSVASEDQDGNCHFFPFGGLPDVSFFPNPIRPMPCFARQPKRDSCSHVLRLLVSSSRNRKHNQHPRQVRSRVTRP